MHHCASRTLFGAPGFSCGHGSVTEELFPSGDPKKSFEVTNQFSERGVNMSKKPFPDEGFKLFI